MNFCRLFTYALTLCIAAAFAANDTLRKNIKTDYRAVGDSIASEKAAFGAFNTWAKTQTAPVKLIVPAGQYRDLGSDWMADIKDLTIEATGASFVSGTRIGKAGVFVQDSMHEARIASVSAGFREVTLLIPGQDTLFTVGNWVALTAIDLMGYGYPPNANFHEYLRIVSKNAGRITFDTPLEHSYSSTYPHFWDGNRFEIDQGGPATLYALRPGFDTRVVVRGVALDFTGGVVCGGLSATLENCRATSPQLWPSVTKSYRIINSTIGFVEVDKILDSLVFAACSTRQIAIQSSEPNHLIIDGGVVQFLNGTAKNTIIRNNARIGDIVMGCLWYGVSQSLTIENSIVDTLHGWTKRWDGSHDSTLLLSNWTRSGSTFRIPKAKAGTPLVWGIPGALLYVANSQGLTLGCGLLKDIYLSGTDIVIETDFKDSVFNYPNNAPWRFEVNPCPSITFRNTTGCSWAQSWSKAPAGIPFWSWYSVTMTPTTTYKAYVEGRIEYYKVRVTKAYTGTAESLYLYPNQNGIPCVRLPNGANAPAFNPGVNLKVTGERIYSPTGATGLQTGDATNEDSKAWISAHNTKPFFGSAAGLPVNISSEDQSVWPQVEVELLTDQTTPSQGTGTPVANPASTKTEKRFDGAYFTIAHSTVEFTLAAPQILEISVFDMRGALVKQLASGFFSAGAHQVSLNGSLAAGTYLVALRGKGMYHSARVIAGR